MSVTPEEMARLKDLRLIPGMPVEAFVRTDQRMVASFLMKPFADNLNRALRE